MSRVEKVKHYPRHKYQELYEYTPSSTKPQKYDAMRQMTLADGRSSLARYVLNDDLHKYKYQVDRQEKSVTEAEFCARKQ